MGAGCPRTQGIEVGRLGTASEPEKHFLSSLRELTYSLGLCFFPCTVVTEEKAWANYIWGCLWHLAGAHQRMCITFTTMISKSLWREFSGQGMNGLDCVKGKGLVACQEKSPGLVIKSPHTHTPHLLLCSMELLCPNLLLEPFHKLNSRQDYSSSPTPQGCQIFCGRKDVLWYRRKMVWDKSVFYQLCFK